MGVWKEEIYEIENLAKKQHYLPTVFNKKGCEFGFDLNNKNDQDAIKAVRNWVKKLEELPGALEGQISDTFGHFSVWSRKYFFGFDVEDGNIRGTEVIVSYTDFFNDNAQCVNVYVGNTTKVWDH